MWIMTPPSRLTRSITTIAALCVVTTLGLTAQRLPDIEPGIEGSVARIFEGRGHILAVDLRWTLPVDFLSADHSLGFQAWYGISHVRGSHLIGFDRRRLMGVGADWQTSFSLIDDHLRPYVSVPVHLVRSAIFDPTGLFLSPPVEPLPSTGSIPTYNLPGAEVGVAYGAGAGCEVWLAEAVGIDAGIMVLRQHLYDDSGPPWVFFSFGLRYAAAR